ncbi:MAG: hypothetical protein U5L03_09940 [Burkholderiaceae bacterium]|nr:hypothetical protein [Burkholderiaceae bacterium]
MERRQARNEDGEEQALPAKAAIIRQKTSHCGWAHGRKEVLDVNVSNVRLSDML